MHADWLKKFQPLAAGVAVGVILVGVWQYYASVPVPAAPGGAYDNVMASSAPVTAALASAQPVRLVVPKLQLDAPFTEPLGLDAEREIEVPDVYDAVGWYRHSPTPGELGPAIILGHVDSYTGPAIFFSLGQLAPGDEIFVERADGSTARFEVTALERYDQSAFPTEKVYGNIDHAGLRLITCTGTFNRGQQRYTHNLVVYARLAP